MLVFKKKESCSSCYSRVCTSIIFQIEIILSVDKISRLEMESKIITRPKIGDELYEMNKGRAIEGTLSKLFHEIMFYVLFPD